MRPWGEEKGDLVSRKIVLPVIKERRDSVLFLD